MKTIYLLLFCLQLNFLAGQSILNNIFVEGAVNSSTSFNRSCYYQSAPYDLEFNYDKTSNLWTSNYNFGLGYCLNQSFEIKFLYRRNNFRNNTDGRRYVFGNWTEFENSIEKSTMKSLSFVTTYLRKIKPFKIEIGLGLDLNRIEARDDRFYFLGLDENSMGIYTSLGIIKDINSFVDVGLRIYSSHHVYGNGSYGIQNFEIDGKYNPHSLGLEFFVKYRPFP